MIAIEINVECNQPIQYLGSLIDNYDQNNFCFVLFLDNNQFKWIKSGLKRNLARYT